MGDNDYFVLILFKFLLAHTILGKCVSNWLANGRRMIKINYNYYLVIGLILFEHLNPTELVLGPAATCI